MESLNLTHCTQILLNDHLNSSVQQQRQVVGATNLSTPIDVEFFYVDSINSSYKFYNRCQELLKDAKDILDSKEILSSSCDIGFRESYGAIHGYLALCICIIGSITNLLNVIILTRKEMINSTNTILTGLAVVDLMILVEYIGFAYSYVRGKENFVHSYSHAAYVLFHAHFTQIAHTISICLAITLAVWRYIAICTPHLNLILCTLPRSRLAVALAYTISILITLPNCFLYSIRATISQSDNRTQYFVMLSESTEAHVTFRRCYLPVYGFLIKLLPCVLLSFFILKIIRAMNIAKERKANLFKMSSTPPSNDSENAVARKIPHMEKLTEKTTRMLLAVLFMFLVVELPQSVLTLLTALHGDQFFEKCYMEWGDLMDLMALINSAANFFLYYIMSQQFRLTMGRMVVIKESEPPAPSQRPNETAVSTLV
ncbi:G-protein coupled receptor dmsr-1 [Hyalella azteca]|uniref:G-protein coupled receptor dmsr-1 n=1 Tax=Hyalella azteca TaxID=294128 RepID=A0A8B7NUA7_HYAAZ|nr:G-protein coupled receptor dmsr-1 [Hyalella azteca]